MELKFYTNYLNVFYKKLFTNLHLLGALVKLRNATVSLLVSVCLPVRPFA